MELMSITCVQCHLHTTRDLSEQVNIENCNLVGGRVQIYTSLDRQAIVSEELYGKHG